MGGTGLGHRKPTLHPQPLGFGVQGLGFRVQGSCLGRRLIRRGPRCRLKSLGLDSPEIES